MGDPRLPRRVWKKPKRPLNYDLKMSELKTLGEFGLKTKRELWKAHTELSRLRNQARSILALGQDVRQNKEPILIRSLVKVGLVPENSTLDDVLNLQVVDMLSRRLQTIVMKNLGFKTPYQARQAVTHGHIMIGERIVDIPSYVVRVDEEKSIKLVPNSPMKEVLEKIKKEAKEAPPVETDQTEVDESKSIPTESKPADVRKIQMWRGSRHMLCENRNSTAFADRWWQFQHYRIPCIPCVLILKPLLAQPFHFRNSLL